MKFIPLSRWSWSLCRRNLIRWVCLPLLKCWMCRLDCALFSVLEGTLSGVWGNCKACALLCFRLMEVSHEYIWGFFSLILLWSVLKGDALAARRHAHEDINSSFNSFTKWRTCYAGLCTASQVGEILLGCIANFTQRFSARIYSLSWLSCWASCGTSKHWDWNHWIEHLTNCEDLSYSY